MPEIELTILKEDLDTACYLSNTDCPIARSLKREGMKNVSVGGTKVSFSKKLFSIINMKYENIDISGLSDKVKDMMHPMHKPRFETRTFTYKLVY